MTDYKITLLTKFSYTLSKSKCTIVHGICVDPNLSNYDGFYINFSHGGCFFKLKYVLRDELKSEFPNIYLSLMETPYNVIFSEALFGTVNDTTIKQTVYRVMEKVGEVVRETPHEAAQ
jgi:hypothetical protein